MSGLSSVVRLAEQPLVRAPDGSQVRELVRTERTSMVHCSLRQGATSRGVRHRSVEEEWYVLSGEGELWRSCAEREDVVALAPGCSLSLAPGVAFQFRNTGRGPLELLIATSPPWPGASEAEDAEGPWSPDPDGPR